MLNPPITGNDDLDAYLYDLHLNGLDNGVVDTANTDASNGNPVGYQYQYIHVKYADDNVGTNLSNDPTYKLYWGIYNSDSSTESTNPTDYTWYPSLAGFGTLTFVYYLILGGRQIKFAVDTAPPDYKWKQDDGTAIDLDSIVPKSTISLNEILDGAVTELKLADAAVTAAKTNIAALDQATGGLKPNTVSAAQIMTDAVTNLKIADGAVTALKTDLAAISPLTGGLNSNTVSTAQLVNDAVTDLKVATNAITNTKIADNAVTSSKIIANAVVSDKIAANAIVAGKIATGAVTAGTIAAGSIVAADIAANTITGSKIAADTIGAGNIAAGAITTVKLEAGAVTADKILAGSVTSEKIVAGAVTALQLAAGAVTADKILANTITGDKIAANTVTASNIDSRSLSIKDAAGNVILSAGVPLDYSNIVASTGWLNSNITINSNGTLSGAGTGQVSLGGLGAGNFATLNQITAANISTYIDTAAIGTAYIGNAAITNAKISDAAITSAKIGNAQVDTLQIAGQAVTIPSSVYTAGTVSSTFQPFVVQTLSVTSTGAPIVIIIGLGASVTYLANSSGNISLTATLKRSGTSILSIVVDSASFSSGSPVGVGGILTFPIIDTPGTGTFSYTIDLTTSGLGYSINNLFASNRSITALEVKR